jgi:hypothetical protein
MTNLPPKRPPSLVRTIGFLAIITAISLLVSFVVPILMTPSFSDPLVKGTAWGGILLIAIVLVVVPTTLMAGVIWSIAIPFEE